MRVTSAFNFTPASYTKRSTDVRYPPWREDQRMDADEIVSRAFGNLYGFSSCQDYEIQSKGGLPVRSRIAHRAGDLDRFLGRLHSDPRGDGMLVVEMPGHVYQARVYTEKTKRDRPFQFERHHSLFGTSLWWEDFLPKRAKDWTAQLVQEGEHGGRKAWQVRLEPNGLPSAYAWARCWFEQARPIVLEAEFYRDDVKVRTMKIDPNDVDEKEGHFIPTQLTFYGSTETTVEISNIDIKEYDEHFFGTQNLRNKNRP
jgi:hypothetical protein